MEQQAEAERAAQEVEEQRLAQEAQAASSLSRLDAILQGIDGGGGGIGEGFALQLGLDEGAELVAGAGAVGGGGGGAHRPSDVVVVDGNPEHRESV